MSNRSSLKKNIIHRSSRKGGTVFDSLLPAITLLAFLIRFIVSCQLIANDSAASAPSVITDMRTYIDLADQILRGNLPDVFYYQPFYYAVFLPFCRMLTPTAYMLALIQSVLGAVTVYLAGRSAQLIFGRRSGLWSAILCCFCAIHICFTPYALLELLQGFWITLLFYLALQFRNHETRLRWAVWGFILGCSILTRGNTWCLLPLPILYAFVIQGRKQWKKIACNTLIMIFCTILPQLPFALYNSIHLQRFSGPSTAGNAVLAIGNNPEGAPAGLDLPYPKTYELWMSSEKEISIPKRIFTWLKEEPAAFMEQQFQKLFLFWDSFDYPNNITEYNFKKSSLIRVLHFLPTGVILLFGLAGFFCGFYRKMYRVRKGYALLSGFILLYSASIIAFYILARFRLPILPLLCVSGGIFIERMIRSKKTVRLRLVCIGAAACFIVYGFAPLYALVYEPSITAWTRPNGVQTEFEKSPYPWTTAPQGFHFLMSTDHTSVVKNGWIGLGNDLRLTKKFRCKRVIAGNRALLILAAPGETGGYALLTANGERRFVEIKDRLILMEIPVIMKDNEIRVDLHISNASGKWTLAGDTLRNYGRTYRDEKAVPFELAAWLVIPF